MPRRARRCATSALTSSPLNTMEPSVGGRSPISVRISVDLPTPLRPITATISPSRTSMSMPCSTGLPPYPDRSLSVERTTSLRMTMSQIDRRDTFVGDNLVDRALGENPAEVKHGDAPGNLPDETHVVLDRENCNAAGV